MTATVDHRSARKSADSRCTPSMHQRSSFAPPQSPLPVPHGASRASRLACGSHLVIHEPATTTDFGSGGHYP